MIIIEFRLKSTPIDTTVFRNLLAEDIDAGVNGLVEYFIVEGSTNYSSEVTLTASDGYGTFAITFPHQGQITLARSLDYERVQKYYVTVVASDRARNVSERLSATTTLVVNVADSDDLDPSFIYKGCVLLEGACINPEYTASVNVGVLQGVLPVQPERIQAVDLDTISAPIRYSFLKGVPSNYRDYFMIDENTGILKHIKAIDATAASEFEIIVKAEEVSEQKRFATAKLTVKVKRMDTSPPIINASAVVGFVEENSSIGTRVLDENGSPILLSISDGNKSDLKDRPEYIFELTTPSFIVSKSGNLVVNENDLDRDPPSPGVYRFQLVAREATSNTASPPLSLTVTLLDVNDNAPKLPSYEPVTIKAGDGRRFVAQVEATDIDEGENAKIKYSIYHISNNGQSKFMINELTGVIETKGRVSSGEQYSLTVQATDAGGLQSQTIVEVMVTPGPNLRPPKFSKPVYEVQISEGAEINSTVVVVHADDPENETISFSIMSGDDLRQFSIHDNGVVTVSRKLDREDLTRYQLTIRAEDSGRLSSTATVNIRVTDINDKNPEFDDQTMPYEFNVDEGRADAYVGAVHASDADEGINAQVSYSVPDDVPFKVNASSGEIRTKSALDFESQEIYKFVVTAKDGASEPRLGTTTVTIRVNDIPDELPHFDKTLIEIKVPENIPNYLLTTVAATDPDTIQQITYTLREGRSDLFRVDPRSGEVRTISNLDYEQDTTHELVVGTAENEGNEKGDFVKIVVMVQDRNDVAPVFNSQPIPITINDDEPIGTEIAEMSAHDDDGSYPNNEVRYEIVGRGKTLAFFQIDSETAVIKIKDDLTKEMDSEYRMDIRAYDLGEPQLSTTVSLTIYTRHFVEENGGRPVNQTVYYMKPLDAAEGKTKMRTEILDIGFASEHYKIKVSENARVGSTIKVFDITNINNLRRSNAAIKCTMEEESDYFVANFAQTTCIVTLRKPLDYESRKMHDVSVALSSDNYYINSERSVVKLTIVVQDENDNAPEFIFDPSYGSNVRNSTYYATVQPAAFIDTSILQVKTVDRDSGDYGRVLYRIYDKDSRSNFRPSTYFSIGNDTGVVRVHRGLKMVQHTPLIFFVEAIDNNGDLNNANTLKTEARIVVNFLTDANRLALAFSDLPPKALRTHSNSLKNMLAEKSNGYIVMIEGFSNRQYVNGNGLTEEDPDATDVWFYIIDPKTERILDRNDALIQTQFFEKAAQSDINYEASNIAKATAQGIYSPVANVDQIHRTNTAVVVKSDVFPYTLIAVALLIVIFGAAGIVYICVSWSKYKNFKQRMRQYSTATQINGGASVKNFDTMNTIMVSRPASQHSDTQSQMKEYETQVLAMAVNTDEVDDLQLDFSAKNHAFNLDNVSYITHRKNGESLHRETRKGMHNFCFVPHRPKQSDELRSNYCRDVQHANESA